MTIATLAAGINAIHARLDRMERALAAGTADDDGWTRLPAPKARCPVSGWSRSTILRQIDRGAVRSKSVSGCRYYAAADVRRILSQ